MKRALITGVTGQDGAYLSEHLLGLGYEVFGGFRRTSSVNFWRLEELGILDHPALKLVDLDLTDQAGLIRIMDRHRPDEVYNLGAQSFVAVSFEKPLMTTDITGKGAVHLLEAIRIVDPSIRFYQASTSEMFGKVQTMPQIETTPFYPRSPYGVAKLFAHWMTINYRESYGIFGASGILFNHESPLRGREFVTRKITDGVARIVLGKTDCLELGNLSAQRDWGFAGDYVKGMHSILQVDQPDTFVLATNRATTVREFVAMSFKAADIAIEWSGKDEHEVGRVTRTGAVVVRVNPQFYRPAEVDVLLGDPSYALEKLGWRAETSLETLCDAMVKADFRRVQDGKSF